MKCPNCGVENEDSNNTCTKCGESLKTNDTVKGGNSLKIIVGLAIVIIVVAGALVVTGAINFSDDNSQETVVNDTNSSNNQVQSVDTSNNVDSNSSNVKYVASANSDKFHKPDCEWAQEISSSNEITYPSREAAIDAGKVPCQVCNP